MNFCITNLHKFWFSCHSVFNLVSQPQISLITSKNTSSAVFCATGAWGLNQPKMIKTTLHRNPWLLIKKRLKVWCKLRTCKKKLLKGCVLSGIFGTGNGATSFSENIGAIAITRVASRYVMAISGLALIFLSEGI